MVIKSPLINIHTLKNTKNKWLVLVSIFFVLFSGVSAQGAVLYFEPSTAQLKIGQEFEVKVKIDPEKECINTIKADIEYDKDLLIAKDFLTGNSIISLWLKKPEIKAKEGKISFVGGIPGGFCGKIPGDPGESDTLGEIVFKVPEFLVSDKNIAKVKFLESSKVLLNDGLGTEADLKLKKGEYEILKEKFPEKILEKELSEDKTPPEPFGILVLKDPQIFEGKYFITFNTQDKQTGIDHYEVKEGNRNWKIAESPYLLEDQKLQSIIKVKAVDKAGNERIVEFPPYLPQKPPFLLYFIVLVLVLLGISVIWYFIKRYPTKAH